MKTYTSGTTPTEVIEEALPHKYPMELNKHDMLMLLEALNFATGREPTGEEYDLPEWSIDFRSSILQTIGIEEI